MKKTLSLIAIVLLIGSMVYANDYPIRVIKGKQYYEYTVEKSEGLFAISRKFNVSQAQLLELNPELAKQNGLKLGQKILVPIEQPVVQTSTQPYREYVVQPKETLYSLARLNGVTIDELVALNPELKDGLKAKQTIKIPIKETKKQPAKPISSTAKQTPKREKRQTATDNTIPVVFEKIPRSEPVEEPVAISKDSLDDDSENKQILRVALMLPFMSNSADLDGSSDKFVEFYKGVLIALKEAKEKGVSVEMSVFDTEKSTDLLDSILQTPFFAKADLIIGPAYTAQAEIVLKFAEQHHIYTVIPFTSHLETQNQNPYLMQFNPSFEDLFTMLSDQIVHDSGKDKVVIARFQGTDDEKSETSVSVFEQTLMKHKKNYNEFYITKDNVGTLTDLAASNGTLLFLASRNSQEVASLLPDIAALNIPRLSILGYEEWGSEWLSYLPNTYYYSLFNAKTGADAYDAAYGKMFGKQGKLSVPAYDLIGYDLMSYFTAIWQNNHKIEPYIKSVKPHFLQSHITFSQTDSMRKWVNLNYYLFRYNGKQTQIVKQ